MAAPVFRGLVQQYFEGRRTYRFPWETSVGVLELEDTGEEEDAGPPVP
jgi:hypothetical protein